MSDEFGYESLGLKRVVTMTDDAICFDDPMDPEAEDLWVPISVMEDPSIFPEPNAQDELFVREWWAEREGLV